MRRPQQAFTLIELMITIVIMAILVSLAAPSFFTMIRNNQSQALGEEFVVGLNTARSEAVSRGREVSFCASNAADNAAEPDCGNDWTNGWVVLWVDDDGDSQVVRHWGQDDLPDDAVIDVARDNNANRIRFTGTGMLPPTDDSAMTASLHVDGCRGNSGRIVTVGAAGMVSVARSEDLCAD